MPAKPVHSRPVYQVDGPVLNRSLDRWVNWASAGLAHAPLDHAIPIGRYYEPPPRQQAPVRGYLDGYPVFNPVYGVVYPPDIRRWRGFLAGSFVYVAVARVTVGMVTAWERVVLSCHPGPFQAWPDLALFKFLARRDFRREALFRWITPLEAARSSALKASPSALSAASPVGLLEMTSRAALTFDLLKVRRALFLSALRCWVRMLFALGMFGSS